jgi:hypothetical protein
MTVAEVFKQAVALSLQERKELVKLLVDSLDVPSAEKSHLLEEKEYYTAEELLMMPAEQRSQILAAAFEAVADDEFEIFEAYSEEDFGD